mgnify:CR=1 FL=1
MNNNKDIILPIAEQIKTENGEYCYNGSIQQDGEWVKTRICNPQYKYSAGFVGLRKYSSDSEKGINLEKEYDYKKLFEKTTSGNNYNG